MVSNVCRSSRYENKDNILYQDNMSAIRMEKYGKRSCTKRTRHINIRYFFICDKVNNKEVSIEYCPTTEMIADYFSKLLGGSQFRKMWNLMLGIDEKDMSDYRLSYHRATHKRYQRNHPNQSPATREPVTMNDSYLYHHQSLAGVC